MRAKKGFTLVEILIVVVILGILAAIVIPQFTEASTEAKTSSLVTDLQSVRSQIQLYKVNHNDNLPGVPNGTQHPATGATFSTAMTGYTDVFGAIKTSTDPNTYGPYLMKIPTNQFVDTSNVSIGNTNGVPPAADPSGAFGWFFDQDTGAFWAIDTADHLKL
jgi:general secretion pathway protein G